MSLNLFFWVDTCSACYLLEFGNNSNLSVFKAKMTSLTRNAANISSTSIFCMICAIYPFPRISQSIVWFFVCGCSSIRHIYILPRRLYNVLLRIQHLVLCCGEHHIAHTQAISKPPLYFQIFLDLKFLFFVSIKVLCIIFLIASIKCFFLNKVLFFSNPRTKHCNI